MDEPENYNARANLVWCSTMALNGLIGVGVPPGLGHPYDWARNHGTHRPGPCKNPGRDSDCKLEDPQNSKERETGSVLAGG